MIAWHRTGDKLVSGLMLVLFNDTYMYMQHDPAMVSQFIPADTIYLYKSVGRHAA